MKLGVHIGYWGLGLTSEDQLRIVQQAERLGYDSVWAAGGYGSDPAVLEHLPDARTERGDDGDDRGDARSALRRAHDPRDRLVRTAGRRGLARAAPRPPAPAHPRVRRRR